MIAHLPSKASELKLYSEMLVVLIGNIFVISFHLAMDAFAVVTDNETSQVVIIVNC